VRAGGFRPCKKYVAILFLFIICFVLFPITQEDGAMALRLRVSEFSSLTLCFAAAYVWLLVG